ncbi:MAG: DUF1592 domain-containing protein [Myxococcales bacterium]
MNLRRHFAIAAGIFASAAVGCVGVVSPGEDTNPGRTGDPGDPGDPGNPNTQFAVNCPSNTPVPPLAVPLQRLNDLQYSNIVGQLFGGQVTVKAAFPPPLTGYLYSTYSGANPMGEAQTQAALEAAEAVAIQVADIVPACSMVSAETSCASTYLKDLATRAFRSPATAADMTTILAAYSAARPKLSYAESVAVGVETILQMPRFLYVMENQPTAPGEAATTLTGLELAQRMALLYWNALPDQALLDAAQSGGLANASDRLAQAQRMLQDPRAHAAISDFLLQWMKVKDFHADTHSAEIQAALDEEMRRDIDHALAADNGLDDLIASRQTSVNSVLEKFYGLPSQSAGPTDWRVADMDAEQRVGILTHPLLMAKFAHGKTPSPILRGKFVRVMLMCDDLSGPPPGAQAMQDDLTPAGATVQEQSQARLDSASCGACHKMMDPIGFGFSAFDGAGNYLPTAGGQAVDVSGHIESTSDLGGDFSGARELGDRLAKSPKVQSCLSAQWMRYAFGTKEAPADACSVQALATRFGQENHSLNALFAGLSALDSFAQRRAVAEGSP